MMKVHNGISCGPKYLPKKPFFNDFMVKSEGSIILISFVNDELLIKSEDDSKTKCPKCNYLGYGIYNHYKSKHIPYEDLYTMRRIMYPKYVFKGLKILLSKIIYFAIDIENEIVYYLKYCVLDKIFSIDFKGKEKYKPISITENFDNHYYTCLYFSNQLYTGDSKGLVQICKDGIIKKELTNFCDGTKGYQTSNITKGYIRGLTTLPNKNIVYLFQKKNVSNICLYSKDYEPLFVHELQNKIPLYEVIEDDFYVTLYGTTKDIYILNKNRKGIVFNLETQTEKIFPEYVLDIDVSVPGKIYSTNGFIGKGLDLSFVEVEHFNKIIKVEVIGDKLYFLSKNGDVCTTNLF